MKDYKKYFITPEEPVIVYQALTTQETICLWTSDTAVYKKEIGTEFSIYGENIQGVQLHFEDEKEIVQQWFLQEIDKPEDASLVSIKLFADKKGTSLLVEQNNIPDKVYDTIVSFWETTLMKDLKGFYHGK